MVDARKGVLAQTRRHAIIARLLGIRYVVLAINKMDLVNFDQGVFDAISSCFAGFAESLGFWIEINAIPISARFGDNVSSRSPRMPWYTGKHLLDYLEMVEVGDNPEAKPAGLPLQSVNKPMPDWPDFWDNL